MMIISNTEVTMYSTCQRSHYYRFIMQIEPRRNRLSPALVRGIVGHQMMDSYYQVKQAGGDSNEAKEQALDVLNKEIALFVAEFPEDFELMMTLTELKGLLEGYAQYYVDEPFRVIETETMYSTEIISGIRYALRADLLVEYVKGLYRGKIGVIDHKFVYNFKTQAELSMDGQLPKYAKTITDESDHVVSLRVFNQIRYRSKKDAVPKDKYLRTPVKTTSREIEKIWSEQLTSALRIKRIKELPIEVANEEAVRNQNPMICKYCGFEPLCKAERMGEPTVHMIKANYQPNTYGYETMSSDD